MTAFNNLTSADIKVGDALPAFNVPITARLVVSAAIATQDFQDVHHDKAAAQEKGTPDIFMNIMTTNGFVGRYLTDWAGPGSRIKKIRFNLGAPNYPGDTMIMSGEVKELTEENGHSLVHLDFRGKNGMGNHVSGSAIIQLADVQQAVGNPETGGLETGSLNAGHLKTDHLKTDHLKTGHLRKEHLRKGEPT